MNKSLLCSADNCKWVFIKSLLKAYWNQKTTLVAIEFDEVYTYVFIYLGYVFPLYIPYSLVAFSIWHS